MAIITLRSIKGSPLTIAEADANIANLNTELGGKLDIASYTPADILSKLLTVDGSGSGLDADKLQGKLPLSTNTVSSIVARDSSGNFSAGTITANLIGNVTGNLTGNVTGNVSGNASNVNGVVQIANGGTGGSTVDAARTALGIGTLASQAANNVAITGGTISGITALAIADGGTGSTTAAIARVNLGVNIGTDVQAYSAILNNLSAVATNGFLVKTAAGTTATRTLQAGTNIGITNGDGISGSPTISLIDSPSFTGTPTAPTATAGTSTTQIATTAFTTGAVNTAAGTQQTYTDNKFNSVAGLAKAWVIFNGSTSSIVASKNVSAVSSDGAGQYTITISNGVFTDGNFTTFGTCGGASVTGTSGRFVEYVSSTSTSLVVYTITANYDTLTQLTGTIRSQNTGQIRIAMFN